MQSTSIEGCSRWHRSEHPHRHDIVARTTGVTAPHARSSVSSAAERQDRLVAMLDEDASSAAVVTVSTRHTVCGISSPYRHPPPMISRRPFNFPSCARSAAANIDARLASSRRTSPRCLHRSSVRAYICAALPRVSCPHTRGVVNAYRACAY